MIHELVNDELVNDELVNDGLVNDGLVFDEKNRLLVEFMVSVNLYNRFLKNAENITCHAATAITFGTHSNQTRATSPPIVLNISVHYLDLQPFIKLCKWRYLFEKIEFFWNV